MKCFQWFIGCLLALSASGQEKLVMTGKFPDQYVVHTVTSETSLQSISNQFGQSVTRLSTYNGFDPAKTLPKGTHVKIPLTQYNLVRSKGDESSAPVYHRVEKGENLYRLSKDNNVPLATLKQWNGLKADAVKIGDLVIVGYMVNARIKPAEQTQVAKSEEKKAIPGEERQPRQEPVVKPESQKPAAKETTPLSVEPAAVTVPVVQQQQPAATGDYIPREGDEGYFATLYAIHPGDQSKQFHSGDAATFKTISGWTDRKYYVLMNDVAPETIIRITAPNNRSICAKVLGPLQETKGGSGLLLRMSNSAASTLGITDPKFTVTITYFE